MEWNGMPVEILTSDVMIPILLNCSNRNLISYLVHDDSCSNGCIALFVGPVDDDDYDDDGSRFADYKCAVGAKNRD